MLGDTVESALGKLGITSERVEKWLGKPCHCKERKRKLNALHNWALQLLHVSKDCPECARDYVQHLEQLAPGSTQTSEPTKSESSS